MLFADADAFLQRALVVGDVDGDGDLDFLTATDGLNRTVSLRLNNGQGRFGGGQELSTGQFPKSLSLSDVDGDGDLDLRGGGCHCAHGVESQFRSERS